jgi:hypothetical protein
MSCAAISKELMARGLEASERTVRGYLSELRERGQTESLGRRGHRLTEAGLEELQAATALERVGILSAKIDEMTYRMSFDLASRCGTVVINTSIVKVADLLRCADDICQVFEKGYAMGHLMALVEEGSAVGQMTIPLGYVGFCTVCSITVNGVLLKNQIPTRSKFGGVLDVVNGKATRFVELIAYDGTSIDPLEVFIRSGMTNYLGAIREGVGRIGASFREIPAESRQRVLALADKLEQIGLGAFMEVGHSGMPLYGIPVGNGHAGAVVVGGLNPISILEEQGIRVDSRALSGLMEYSELFHYTEMKERLVQLGTR